MSIFWMGVLFLVLVVACRIVLFKTMTPEQVEKHLQNEKERNRKMATGAAEGAKVLLDLFLSKRK